MTPPVPTPVPDSRKRWNSFVPAIAVAALIFVLSSIPGNRLAITPLPVGADKVAHGLVYSLFGAAVAYPVSKSPRLRVPLVMLAIVAAIGTAYGISDELHQMFTPLRSPDPYDVVADFVGALFGALLFLLFKHLRNNHDPAKDSWTDNSSP